MIETIAQLGLAGVLAYFLQLNMKDNKEMRKEDREDAHKQREVLEVRINNKINKLCDKIDNLCDTIQEQVVCNTQQRAVSTNEIKLISEKIDMLINRQSDIYNTIVKGDDRNVENN